MNTIGKGVGSLLTRWPSGKKKRVNPGLSCTTTSLSDQPPHMEFPSSPSSSSSVSSLCLHDSPSRRSSLITPLSSPRAGSRKNSRNSIFDDNDQQLATPPSTAPTSPEIKAAPEKPKRKTSLEDYIIKQTLGTGTFGRVHLAKNRHNGQHYAIKILNKYDVVQRRQTQHINNEQAIMSTVSHAFVVNLIDTFQDDTHLFFVMEYCPGGELFRILRKQKRFTEDVAKFYAAEVILALEYLHERDIAYRDLKPENILLDAEGHVKLVDFGFAKQVPDVTWTVCGTPDYVAPEIIRSKGYSKAVDWWSLGVLIYEMLVGRPPFRAKNPVDLYEQILDCRVPWSEEISPVAKNLLLGLLTPDLSRRYGNMEDGARDIKDHPFFAGIDFEELRKRNVEAPFRPELKGDDDSTCFDRYDEPILPYGQKRYAETYRSEFPAF